MVDGEGHVGWWRRHGLAAFLLIVAAVTTFVIRVMYSYSLINQCNIAYCFAGGSDSFYHARVMTWIIQNHTNLVQDPLLNYPLGLHNPREPLFDWMNALLGIIFAPLFAGNAVTAAMWFLEMQPPFWAALGAFPVYMVGKEVSSKRMGLLAALLYPLIVGNIQSTVATYANYLSFYAFFVFLTLALYIHTIKISGSRRWVESYYSPRSIWTGFKDFARVESRSLDWAIFSGVAFGATMLAWQGYTYVVAVVVVFLVILVLVERLKKMDPFGPYVTTLITGSIGFAMAMPYYYAQGEFGYWFTVPLMIFYGSLLALLPFLVLRDTPWLFSLGVLLASLGGAAGGLFLYNKNDFNAVITGQGYFVKNLIYSTVAEAQAPSFDSLIVSYGVVTFFIAFVGLAIFGVYLYRQKFRREHLFMVILGIVGIYLPISAAKFFLIGAPLFALLPAEILLFALDKMGYSEMRRAASSLSDRGNTLFALRKSLKARHFLILILAIGILLPNVWYAVDAGIPYNDKSNYNTQLYNTLPTSLRTSASQSSSFYFGAAGIQTDTPSQYDENGYDWLATQDVNTPASDRPAFISWWDYGFQAIEEGKHPAVADNFQDGIDPSGHFLLAQNESLAISVLATDLLYSEKVTKGYPYLPPKLNQELAADGVNVTTLHNYLANTSGDIPMVLKSPAKYGPVSASNLDALNAMYYVVPEYLASTLSENGVVQVYQTVQDYTGWSIAYAMADSRLFPTSGSNTGIYYAPVDLTDGVIGAGGIPTYYFTVTATGTDGNTYPLGDVPPGIQTVSTSINYNPAFYNSMIYHIFIGYNGSQVGQSAGIPGVSNGLTSDSVMPGWMMQHFYMGYRTAYYCPYKNYTEHPGCFGAVSLSQANAYQKANNGTVDASSSSYVSGGETFLEYYPGATITGSVTLSGGTPVSGAHVTVLDQWGIPHQVATTNSHGAYTLLAPPGNDSLIVSYGAVSGVEQIGTQVGNATVHISTGMAESYGAPPIWEPLTLKPASFTGRLYWNILNTTTFSTTNDVLIPGAAVTLTSPTMSVSDVTDPTGTFDFPSLPPGVYNVTVQIGTGTFALASQTLTSGQAQNQDQGLRVAAIHGIVSGNGHPLAGAAVSIVSPASQAQTVYTGSLGNYSFSPLPPGNYTLRAYGGESLVSTPQSVDLSKEGQNASLNLSLVIPLTASVSLTYGGHPIPNFPVRFSPISAASNDSVVVYTGANGMASAFLAQGVWSVYSLGAINGTWVSALADIGMRNGTAGTTVSLSLAATATVEGKVYSSTTAEPGVQINLQSSSGAILQAYTNATGAYHFLVPQGTYTVVAVYASSALAPTESAIGTVVATGTQSLSLTLGASVRYTTNVGYTGVGGAFQPLPGALATLSYNSVTLRMVANSTGAMNVTLPQTSGISYTLTVTDYGFAQKAPLYFQDQSALLATHQVLLGPIPIAVRVALACASSCGTPTLNFTAISGAGNSTSVVATSVNGTLVASTSLSPGTYAITGYSVSGGALWGTVGNTTLVVGVGSLPIAVSSIGLYSQSSYHGSLALSNGGSSTILGVASVVLHSPLGNITLTGTQYSNPAAPFRAPPGSYDIYVSVTNGTQSYAYVGNVTLNTTSSTIPTLTLTPASALRLAFTTTLGTNLHAALNVTLVDLNASAHLARLPFTMDLSGSLDVPLPNATYEVIVNQTVLLNLTGIVHYETLSATGTCVHTLATGACTIALASRSASTSVTGSTVLNGRPLTVAGTVTAIPNAGQPGLVPVSAPIVSGSFSLSVLPGKYTLYAVSGAGGVPEVNVTSLTVPFTNVGVTLSLPMATGWTAMVSLGAPTGVATPSTATINATLNGTKTTVSVPGVSLSSPYAFILPSGVWRVQATAQSSFDGKRVMLLANATAFLLGANAQVSAVFSPQWHRTLSMSMVGATTQPVADGGTVSYSFVVNDTGNAVEHLKFNGAPQGWKFRFTPSNVTLYPTPGQNLVGVEALVTVPNNTLQSQNAITFQAILFGNTTVLGSTSATVSIDPVHNFNLTTTTSQDTIGNRTIVIGFSVKASGNSVEKVSVGVLNGEILNQTGWNYTLNGDFSTLTPGNPAVQGNVTLTASVAGATLPSSITLFAVDRAYPGLTKTLTIKTPSAAVNLPGPVVVTGPGIGTPAPDYMAWLPYVLVVAPAAAILTFTFVRRWWKTRKWVRR